MNILLAIESEETEKDLKKLEVEREKLLQRLTEINCEIVSLITLKQIVKCQPRPSLPYSDKPWPTPNLIPLKQEQ